MLHENLVGTRVKLDQVDPQTNEVTHQEPMEVLGVEEGGLLWLAPIEGGPIELFRIDDNPHVKVHALGNKFLVEEEAAEIEDQMVAEVA